MRGVRPHCLGDGAFDARAPRVLGREVDRLFSCSAHTQRPVLGLRTDADRALTLPRFHGATPVQLMLTTPQESFKRGLGAAKRTLLPTLLQLWWASPHGLPRLARSAEAHRPRRDEAQISIVDISVLNDFP